MEGSATRLQLSRYDIDLAVSKVNSGDERRLRFRFDNDHDEEESDPIEDA